MKYVFHPQALAEYAEAVQYYEDVRRCVAHKFPYADASDRGLANSWALTCRLSGILSACCC